MKVMRQFLANALVGGVLVVLPIYLAVLVLLKGAQSAATLIRPFTMLLPAWLPAENVLSLVLVVTVCFLIGVAVRTRLGKAIREPVCSVRDVSLWRGRPAATTTRGDSRRRDESIN